MTTLEILKAAYNLLDDKKQWCQGRNARNSKGKPVNARSRFATQWCAIGAVKKASPSDITPIALRLLNAEAERLYERPMISVNDILGYRQMRTVFRAAIRNAERGGK